MTTTDRQPSAVGISARDRVNLLSNGLSGTNLERGSSHNLRVTLQAIRLNAPVTKVELAEITGLTPPSITNIARKLFADGLIVEAGRRRGERGQPALKLAINPDGAFSIGVNVDRDHMTLVALDFLGDLRLRIVEPVQFPMPDQVRDFVGRNFDAMRAGGEIDMNRIAGIGLAIPDDFGGVDLPNRPAAFGIWESIDPRQLLGSHGLDVITENDATAAAIGELQFGHGRVAQTFFYLLVNAGLGGGLVIDGHSVTGASGRSGEVGFLPIARTRRNPVVLQDIVSLSGLASHLAEAGIADPGPLDQLGGAAAAAAADWIEKAADLLTDPLMVINAVIDPDAIFIGGRLPAALVDQVCDRLAINMRHRGATLPARAPIRRAQLAEDAAAIGAAILPFATRFLPNRTALMKIEG
mgnify:CR=1 FL=1